MKMETELTKESTPDAKQASSPVETVVIPLEVLDLVRFLAESHMEWYSHRMKALSFTDPKECRDYLIGRFPTIQGTKNMIDMVNIGKQKYDRNNVRKAVDWLLEEGV